MTVNGWNGSQHMYLQPRGLHIGNDQQISCHRGNHRIGAANEEQQAYMYAHIHTLVHESYTKVPSLNFLILKTCDGHWQHQDVFSAFTQLLLLLSSIHKDGKIGHTGYCVTRKTDRHCERKRSYSKIKRTQVTETISHDQLKSHIANLQPRS